MFRDGKTLDLKTFTIIDNFLLDADDHLNNVLANDFEDVDTPSGVFKGIQLRDDFISVYMETLIPTHEVVYNFVRKSPLNQIEPNFIHSDEMMGDLTCILYLSKIHPIDDGTTFYDEDGLVSMVVKSKFNRMLIFDSSIKHCRNIFENFGEGASSRLIQVLFLNKK